MRKITTLVALVMVITLLAGCSLFKKTDTEMTTTGAVTTFDTIPSQGATVSVNYVGTLEDGTVFDTNIAEEAKKAGTGVYSETRTYSPLTFTVGQGQMIPGFEKGVVGMKKGETKTITIPAAEAYGEPKAELMFTTGSALFTEAGITPVVGQSYNFGGAPAKVTKIDGDKVTLDFNHELAGKTLTFKITVLDITAAAGNAPVQNDAPTVQGTGTAQ